MDRAQASEAWNRGSSPRGATRYMSKRTFSDQSFIEAVKVSTSWCGKNIGRNAGLMQLEDISDSKSGLSQFESEGPHQILRVQ
jgi:hypothetical protein